MLVYLAISFFVLENNVFVSLVKIGGCVIDNFQWNSRIRYKIMCVCVGRNVHIWDTWYASAHRYLKWEIFQLPQSLWSKIPSFRIVIFFRLFHIMTSFISFSFLFRYADDSFTSAFVSTVGIDFKVKTVFRHDKRVKLQIWVWRAIFTSKFISISYATSSVEQGLIELDDEITFP